MIRWLVLAVGGLLLAGCASAPLVREGLPGRDVLRDFSIEARFSLKMERLGEPVQNGSGRLAWRHQNGSDQVFLANPLGTGLAEIDITPTLSRLRRANGEMREDADADALLLQVTGYALPVSRLASWLLGRAGPEASLTRDAFGRPRQLREAGWQIDYAYADDAPAALPYRLDINRANEVMLILRIEEWRDAP